MHLRNLQFDKAHTDFFEAFKNYDESGSPRRILCLKYLVLANMVQYLFLKDYLIECFSADEVRHQPV